MNETEKIKCPLGFNCPIKFMCPADGEFRKSYKEPDWNQERCQNCCIKGNCRDDVLSTYWMYQDWCGEYDDNGYMMEGHRFIGRCETCPLHNKRACSDIIPDDHYMSDIADCTCGLSFSLAKNGNGTVTLRYSAPEQGWQEINLPKDFARRSAEAVIMQLQEDFTPPAGPPPPPTVPQSGPVAGIPISPPALNAGPAPASRPGMPPKGVGPEPVIGGRRYMEGLIYGRKENETDKRPGQ
jgi:hypothetical protein